MEVINLLVTIKNGFKKALTTYIDLLKIIIPVYFLVTFLKYTGVIEIIAKWFSPVMIYLGLPGEAMLALLTAYLLNMYAGLAVIAGIDLGVKEITILGVMIGIAHSMIIESAVFKKINVNIIKINILRTVMAILAGIVLNVIL
ncbi:MAG: nucleoside recognition domain-containing protein [bacterium]